MNIEYIPTFNYFSNFVHDWDKDILDFGCNNGNLIKSSKGRINPQQYTGIDVDAEALAVGEDRFPNANWIHYNRYNPVYNPRGLDVLPEFSKRFDIVISYSVFTHMTIEDTISTVEFLMEHADRMLFTFCNVENRECVEWFRNRRVDCDEIAVKDAIYLTDNRVTESYPLHSCNHFVSFYTSKFLQESFSKYSPRIHTAPNGWVQDCIELNVGS